VGSTSPCPEIGFELLLEIGKETGGRSTVLCLLWERNGSTRNPRLASEMKMLQNWECECTDDSGKGKGKGTQLSYDSSHSYRPLEAF